MAWQWNPAEIDEHGQWAGGDVGGGFVVGAAGEPAGMADMTPRTVRCFGGPLHDKVVTVDTTPFLALDHDSLSPLSWSIDNPPEVTDRPRSVRYDFERFWLHDDANCRNKWLPARARIVLCRDAACTFLGEVAVADGHNAQIVADVAAGLWGLVTAAIGAGWRTPKVAPR